MLVASPVMNKFTTDWARKKKVKLNFSLKFSDCVTGSITGCVLLILGK